MRLELMGVTTLMSVVKNAKIFVKTFDGFDVYVNGRLIYFPSSKAKEMLAVLVEKRGSSVSLSQCRLPRCLTKPRQRRSEWDMAGSDGISRVSAVFRGKSLLTNKMRII